MTINIFVLKEDLNGKIVVVRFFFLLGIHQFTVEFRFRNSLAQERFQSNLEFRYQIIVSSINFRKCFAKFMIPIAFFKKFLS